jgi:hypothetical protein
MRGIGAAARRGAQLHSSYAAAFSSFSGIGGGAGRGRRSGSGPSSFGQQPRAPWRPIPDDEDADPFSAPASVGRGRGDHAAPANLSFSAFSGVGRSRGSPLPPPPPAEDAPKQHVATPPKTPLRPPIQSGLGPTPSPPRCSARPLPLHPAPRGGAGRRRVVVGSQHAAKAIGAGRREARIGATGRR